MDMCGIAAVLFKDKSRVGEVLIDMMRRFQHRGTDSSGVAIYGGLELSPDEFLMKIEVIDEDVVNRKKTREYVERVIMERCDLDAFGIVNTGSNFTVYDAKVSKMDFQRLRTLVKELNSIERVTVLSAGKFELVKDIGPVEDLEKNYNISTKVGTHAIGHTRYSTESAVDRYRAHPFQSFVIPDITVVHNGQITNYWKIRALLEEKGHIFTTDNDTECIVHYIADKLKEGYSLQEALEESVRDLDGPFAYVIATQNEIGVAKDKLGLRPALVGTDTDMSAIASEEVSLEIFDLSIEYLYPGEVVTFGR
jgi:glutamate synthase domain-containing protein 1